MILLIVVVALGLINVRLWTSPEPRPEQGPARFVDLKREERPPISFNGSSEKLKDTVILPTLERPVPKGKSAVWCATFAMAWQRLEKDIVKGPLMVRGAEEICRELSRAPTPELESGDFYAEAGLLQPGTWERVNGEIEKRFPGAPPLAPAVNAGAFMVACLKASLVFEFEFKDSAEPFEFHDSRGGKTRVHAFGLRETDNDEESKGARDQVKVLFRKKGRFAVDLSRKSGSYQIVLALVDRQPTLQATLDEVAKGIADGTLPKPAKPGDPAVSILLVPSMHWKVAHHFRTLENETVNYSLPVAEACQFMHFNMDRKGAALFSQAWGSLPNGDHPEVEDPHPDQFKFDRPFLVMLRKRGAEHPFFVMWVDNAELLQKR